MNIVSLGRGQKIVFADISGRMRKVWRTRCILQPRRFTVIAGQVEDHEKIALVHVEGNDLVDVYENAILTLKRNVADREWEVLYTFPGLIEPEEYFLEEVDAEQEAV
jgi:hypothetical protein